MSKYKKLWEYVDKTNKDRIELTFDEIETILGFPIDHSFLTYKKELSEYGFEVGKISMKNKVIVFLKK